jgi:uncharacterized membrane protein
VFVALFAPVLIRERTDRRVFLALPLSMAGVGLVVRPELVHGAGPMRGALAAVAAALCSTYSYATLRRIGPRESPEAIALHFSLTAAVVLSTISAAHAAVPDRASLLWMLGAGLTGGLSQIALTRAYSLGRAARVSAIAYLTVIASALLGAVALEEWPTGRAVAGMMLVVAGGLAGTRPATTSSPSVARRSAASWSSCADPRAGARSPRYSFTRAIARAASGLCSSSAVSRRRANAGTGSSCSRRTPRSPGRAGTTRPTAGHSGLRWRRRARGCTRSGSRPAPPRWRARAGS